MHEDPVLLANFVRWAMVGQADDSGRQLTVMEQSLPGEDELSDAHEAERQGLPDGCICDESGWALLSRTKISAALTADPACNAISIRPSGMG